MGSLHLDDVAEIQYRGFIDFDTDSTAVSILEPIACRDPPVCRKLKARTIGMMEKSSISEITPLERTQPAAGLRAAIPR
ncbi:hypothetical protein [Burkholderia sp. BCC0419]|uniref:hypothetical protein n=1 Tax=Burkholderia sp. BCC0419 TaxID=486878 RepID=UPI0015892AD8|nr:hypothetical protein [Burkholderia sp. BCC0419]